MRRQPSLKSFKGQSGTAAVEFALVSLLLFGFLFGAMEVARALYMWSTLPEVVARAARMAAVSSPSDMSQVRHAAMILNAAGKFPLGGDIDETYLRIDYLASDRSPVTTVTSPMDNLLNCTAAPTATNCIRYVRVSLCMPGSNCDPVPYKPMVKFDLLSSFNVNLPTFSTVVAADTLGLAPTH